MDPTGWQPFVPTTAERRRRPALAATWVEPSPSGYTPAPDILATLTFFPVLPSRLPRSQRARPEIVIVEPFDGPTRVHPLSWMPLLAGPLPRQARARQEEAVIDPTFGSGMVVAQSMAWAPQLPNHPRKPHSYRLDEQWFEDITIPAAGIGCAELVDTAFMVTTLLAESVALSTFLGETLTVSTFINEDLC